MRSLSKQIFTQCSTCTKMTLDPMCYNVVKYCIVPVLRGTSIPQAFRNNTNTPVTLPGLFFHHTKIFRKKSLSEEIR